MSARAKFLFDVDFGRGDAAEQKEPTVPLSAHQAAVEDAEKRGYQSGVAAAGRDASAQAERRIAAALEKMAGAMQAIEARLEAEAVEVAVAVAKKLMPELIGREPFAEIGALAAGCFRHIVGSPHVVVRVGDALYEQASRRLPDIARQHGFEGRLVVLAEPHIVPGDCRIEWADGGMVRDTTATMTAINEAVARYVAARRAAAGAETGEQR